MVLTTTAGVGGSTGVNTAPPLVGGSAPAHGNPQTPTTPQLTTAAGQNASARKKTSFQITSVKVHDGVHDRDETDVSGGLVSDVEHGPHNGDAITPHDHKVGSAIVYS